MACWCETPRFFTSSGAVDRKRQVRSIIADTGEMELVKDTLVGSVYYGAWKDKKTGEITALVTPTKVEDGEFYYLLIGEQAGPVYCDCPKSILRLLSDTIDERSLEWRKACERNASRPAASRLAGGTVIAVNHPSMGLIRLVKALCPTRGAKCVYRWIILKDDGHLSNQYLPASSIRDLGFSVITEA